MSELAKDQRALVALLHGASRVTDEPAAVAFADAIATGNARLSPTMQLEIYREQFFLRHLDVLRDDFGGLAHLLGDDAFETLGKAYLQAHPPRTFTLRDLGEHVVRFVAEVAPWSLEPLLADLARVDWAFVTAFDALDSPPLDPRAVTRMDEETWPRARIALHAHVQRLALGHAAHDYRLAVRRSESPPRPEARPCFVLVFRGTLAMQCLDVEPAAFALLDELARGVPLGEACERVSAQEDALGAWFQQWTALGLISRVY